MEYVNFEDCKDLFFVIIDEKTSGDEFVRYFDNFKEAQEVAKHDWDTMTPHDKDCSRISVMISNPVMYPDSSELCSCDNNFAPPTPHEFNKWLKYFAINSDETKSSIEWQEKRKKEQELMLQAKKNEHLKKMAKIDKVMDALKNSSDVEKCIFWKNQGYPQPSGTEIVRIKKELGLSWREFQAFVQKL